MSKVEGYLLMALILAFGILISANRTFLLAYNENELKVISAHLNQNTCQDALVEVFKAGPTPYRYICKGF